MRDICAHNYLEINKEDAAELGIKDGDTVRAVTPLGRRVRGRGDGPRRPGASGAFGVSFGYGHSNYGAQDIDIDGHAGRRATPPSPPACASARRCSTRSRRWTACIGPHVRQRCRARARPQRRHVPDREGIGGYAIMSDLNEASRHADRPMPSASAATPAWLRASMENDVPLAAASTRGWRAGMWKTGEQDPPRQRPPKQCNHCDECPSA